MHETFDLNKMHLSPLTGDEMMKVDGGFFWFLIPIAAFVIGYITGVSSATSK